MAKPRELSENWRDEWRKAGPAHDRENWRDVAREALRFGWWWETRVVLVGLVFLAVCFIIAMIVAAVLS